MSLLIFLAVLSILVIIHEFGHFIMARKSGVKVEEFSVGFGKKLFSLKKKETEYSLRLVPLGGFVRLAGDDPEQCKGADYEFLSKGVLTRAKIIFMGPLLNYILALVLFWAIFIIGYPTLTSKVGGFLDGFPAAASGIEKGDVITAIDGFTVANWEDMQSIIRKAKSDHINVTLERGGEPLTKKVVLKKETVEDLTGRKREIRLMGILPSEDIVYVKSGFLGSFLRAAETLLALTSMTYQALWRMITGGLSVRESVTGPLGMFYITSKAASAGISALLHVMAVISMSLGIFNLLPFPVLDGGHITLLLVEKIKGSRISSKVNKMINDIGFTLIISLAILVFINDIIKFQVAEKLGGFFK
ncbi:MAG: RIP metalloprotease RseP [Candidatus Omnitrophica bacterium]|nr:RIP metalloprotease RseP [Candidatus Omnitrophota bacterium]